ncbi:SRPBCC domain-containing protein [Paenibacillus sp. NPDC056579]|uniref:SRPBCC domain-containing protein n=1 Tax=Paenibacillus sp. NPDC056579 TaxID=3345871 RepID=UPI003689541A
MSYEANSTILIVGDVETVWNALTDQRKLTQWYVPGSPWEIPKLKSGEKMTFTLKPNAHNKLTEKLPMSLTIEKVIPLHEFSFYVDSNQTLISFVLERENGGTRVSTNMRGFDESLANLKALVEGKEIPYI